MRDPLHGTFSLSLPMAHRKPHILDAKRTDIDETGISVFCSFNTNGAGRIGIKVSVFNHDNKGGKVDMMIYPPKWKGYRAYGDHQVTLISQRIAYGVAFLVAQEEADKGLKTKLENLLFK